jgi:hypothetical protein
LITAIVLWLMNADAAESGHIHTRVWLNSGRR